MLKTLKKLRTPHFCLRQTSSPTYANICQYLQVEGWKSTRFKVRAHFNEQHFEFHTKAAEQLEYKHLLANLVSDLSPAIMFDTYCINDQNWISVLDEIEKKYYIGEQQALDQVEDLVWILKPALLNNGQHIKIFQRLSQLTKHYLNTNRLGGEHVLQRYLTQPHLLDKYKYTIRMFVILTNYDGAYIYPKGYFNVALEPYQANDFSNLTSHLTNEHLNEEKANVIQVPIQCLNSFKPIYEQIKKISELTINALKDRHKDAFVCQKERAMAIFGFDFLVDNQLKVWLLEANHGPCFPINDDHPLQKHLYTEFWQAFINSFVLPIAMRQSPGHIQYQAFEPISCKN